MATKDKGHPHRRVDLLADLSDLFGELGVPEVQVHHLLILANFYKEWDRKTETAVTRLKMASIIRSARDLRSTREVFI